MTGISVLEHFKKLGSEIGELVGQKNMAYGDSFGRTGDIMRILYPNGISPGQMDDALTITRVIDKLFRVATHKDAFGESPWKDICGYGLLGWNRDEIRRSQREDTKA